MANLSEKKWFIYLGDHHEGPFSITDIQDKIAAGEVTDAHYVWAEGMADWVVMSTVPDFAPAPDLSPAPSLAQAGQQQGVELNSPQSFETAGAALEPDDGTRMASTDGQGFSPAAGLADVGGAALAAPLKESAPAQATAPVVSSDFGSADQPVGADEKTGDLDPKEIKRLAKEAAKANKASAKGQKKLDKENKKKAKEEAKLAKKRKKDASALGIGGGQEAVVKGGESLAASLFRILLLTLLGVLAGYAYLEGYIDPVLNHPFVKQTAQQTRSIVKPYLGKVIDAAPFLRPYISPLPELEQVDAIEYQELENAALAPIENGPKIGIALSMANPNQPHFYIASNLANGTGLEVHIQGVPETLLNQTSFAKSVQVEIMDGLGETLPLQSDAGGPIPKGEYAVLVVDTQTQTPAATEALSGLPVVTQKLPPHIAPGRKVVFSKRYFLGGEKDQVYFSRLKEYHDKLKEKSIAEIQELKQFRTTAKSQLDETRKTFKRIRKGKMTKVKKRTWSRFSKRWSGLQGQLIDTSKQWTAQQVEDLYFHNLIYVELKRSAELIEAVHNLHNDYVTKRVDKKAYDQKLGEVTSDAETSLANVMGLVEQTELLPPTPNGMPRRLSAKPGE